MSAPLNPNHHFHHNMALNHQQPPANSQINDQTGGFGNTNANQSAGQHSSVAQDAQILIDSPSFDFVGQHGVEGQHHHHPGGGANNDFSGFGRYNATNAGTDGPNSGLEQQPAPYGANATGEYERAGATGPGGGGSLASGNTANATSTGTTANTHGIIGKLQHGLGDVLDAPELQQRGLQKER